MIGLRKAIGRFFSGSKGASRQNGLPLEIRQSLIQQDLPALEQWLQLLREHPDAPEFPALIEEAQKLDWPESQVERLRIFGLYYRGTLAEVSLRAAKYLAEAEFDAAIFNLACLALYHLGRFEAAYAQLRTGEGKRDLLESRPDYSVIAALICSSANRLDEMKQHIDRALKLTPDDPIVACNALDMYLELGEMEDFEEVRRHILQGNYPLDQVGVPLSNVELALGRYEEGFRLMELRYESSEAHLFINRALFDRPRWRGESLAGKRLLVSAEQGLGDAIQMARYVPELPGLGAVHVAMETQAATLSLMQYNFPEFQFVERKYGVSPGLTFDLWTGAMSLPHLLGATAENIPGRTGYLRVPPENADYWHGRVRELARGGRPRIGLAWSGQPTHRADRRRSVPFQRMMEAIRDVDVDFFALQTQVPAVHPANLTDVSAEMVTLADTAALIAEMDLVITVDTSVVHVAGAIGKQAWLLLPYRYEWRWGLEGEGNNWYDSVRVIRQPATGAWDAVLREVFLRRLPEFVADKGGGPCPG